MRKAARHRETIADMAQRIAETFRPLNPTKIILFGSRARGEADCHSDIDLIVVYPTAKRFLDRLEELYRLWDIPCAVDILAYTPEEFEQLSAEREFIKEALREGRVLYEKP